MKNLEVGMRVKLVKVGAIEHGFIKEGSTGIVMGRESGEGLACGSSEIWVAWDYEPSENELFDNYDNVWACSIENLEVID